MEFRTVSRLIGRRPDQAGTSSTFPLVWRAYDPDDPALTNTMQGARGIALNDLHPSGYVEIGAERWQAEVLEGSPPIRRGQRIRVHGIRGLTLLVQPDPKN
jgi:membrane-bound ClpP family serine protease